MKKFVFLIIGLLLLIPIVYAKQGHMKLLAVAETEEGYKGGIAELYLEVKQGSGRVFLETFPLTKVDTQVSTRFAKEIACDFADADCDKYDFFYTITADSSIIAGPSAGAAISVLTFSLIKNVEFDENTAITGTINSGGLIGPVGALNAKIEAASKAGLKKVLIPVGELTTINKSYGKNTSINTGTNESTDLNELRAKYNLDVKEVPALDDAIFEFTGKRFREKKANITISQDYVDTMKMLAVQLCSRSTKLKQEISAAKNNKTKSVFENAINLSNIGKDSFNNNMYYSSASYCFGANVEFNYLLLLQQNLTKEEAIKKVNALREEIKNFTENLENLDVKTITDIETYMIVKERLTEASDFLDIVIVPLNNLNDNWNNKNESLRNLAYAIERLNSAYSWFTFFGSEGKKFDFNGGVIRNACKSKLSEVEERLQYVQLYLPQNLASTRKELNYAYKDLNDSNYELCLFRASKAKANVDAILSLLGIKNENVHILIKQKLDVVERNLVEQIEKGIFPILGYSYFEYATSLKDSDQFSALLYAEYALELSNLDIYFKDEKQIFTKIDVKLWVVFIIGISIGFIAAEISKRGKKRSKRL
ncbi:hypothetical protein HYX01_00560 [Candidatus Woesearchaeota archaeon]|nr:hypothetical protein [Candidatus Woesearchaeota archaeon]